MDVRNARMDGISALKHIMANNPVPVIMVSSLTWRERISPWKRWEYGAVDFIPKNLSDLSLNILRLKERCWSTKSSSSREKGSSPHCASGGAFGVGAGRSSGGFAYNRRSPCRTGAIGTSTGGPKALQEVLPSLPKEFPVPIVIAQHMPPNFTGPFAERLNQLCKLEVREAKEGDVLKPA